MNRFTFFWSASLLLFGLLITGCSSIMSVADDDVYVLSTPTLDTGEELNDESSYQNYKYNRDKKENSTCYGSHHWNSGITLFFGSPYFYPYGSYNYFYNPYGYPYYGPSPYYNDCGYNNWGYNNWGYMGYSNPYYYGYPGYYSPYWNNYYPGYYPGYYPNYYYPNSGSVYANHQNVHLNARYSLSGTNLSGRRANHSSYTGGMSGKKATHSSYSRDYYHGRNTDISSKDARNSGVKRSRPVESGEGLSKNGSRVTTSPHRPSTTGTNTRTNSNGRVRSDYNDRPKATSSPGKNNGAGTGRVNQGTNKGSTGRRGH